MLTTSSHGWMRRPATSTEHGEQHRNCYTVDMRLSSDAQCADRVDKFSDFFVDKVRRICDNITTALLQSPYRLFATGCTPNQNCPLFYRCRSTPSKSPLDVLPCSLLKECADVFAPAITRLANLSLQTGKFPARYKIQTVSYTHLTLPTNREV